jgi:hypothetical protein
VNVWTVFAVSGSAQLPLACFCECDTETLGSSTKIILKFSEIYSV